MIELFVDPSQRRGISAALFEQIRTAITGGRFVDGDRLPPSRELAGELGVSRQTVTTVYGRLVAEGYLYGRAGGGTFVHHRRPTVTARKKIAALVPANVVERERALRDTPVGRGRDLRIGQPDPRLFPAADWRQCMVSALNRAPESYGDPAGLPDLRSSLAHWIGRSRGVEALADTVVVTAGAQQAVYLVARALLRPGDSVAVEDPGYPPVRRLLISLGIRVISVAVDAEGIVVDDIPLSVRAIYVTPSHQSPTGTTMSLSRRHALLALAQQRSIAIIEDDYDSEYRHTDRPLEPLHRLDQSGRVIYIGTFSKTMSPSLRIGFVVLPEPLVEAVTGWREVIDWQPPNTTQHAMRRFIAEGLLERHLRKVRKVYRERHAMVTEAVGDWQAQGLVTAGPHNHAGLHLSVQLADDIAERAVHQHARRHQIALTSLADCTFAPRPHDGLLVGFGLAASDELPETLELLGTSIANARNSRRFGI